MPQNSLKKHLSDIMITVGVIASAIGISFLLQGVFSVWEHVTTVFVFAVFIVSIFTDGYIYGIAVTCTGVLFINYAFTFPYFYVDFSAPASIFSAIVMVIIALMTNALTAKLKKWQTLKVEGEKEMMRANLLRAVSHDLRTPLTTIYGSSSAIIENYETFTDVQKISMLQGIKEDSEWLTRIVENLLSVTKIDSGKAKLLKTPTVLEELINSVLLKFRKRYPTQTVDIDIPEDIIVIPMDAILIEQVMINIFENAVQHARGMTRISLRVFTIGEKAIFEISDDGCGIEKERLDKIFTGYYYSGEQSSDFEKRNAGIGLSVCSTIIKAHGGTITVANAKAGGAVFRFELQLDAYIGGENGSE